MAYFLGKDVDVYMTTEHLSYSVSGGAAAAIGATGSKSILGIGNNDGSPFTSIPDRNTTYGAAETRVSDVIGIDLTPGTRQEEISYFGKNTNVQAEIKKEFIVTLTRKVSDNTFDILFNTPARDGVYDSNGAADGSAGNATLHDGLRTSKNRNFGYRLHIELGNDALGSGNAEVITLRNCCITAHTKTLDANNAQEETIEFYSYVQPVISNDGTISQTTAITGTDEI